MRGSIFVHGARSAPVVLFQAFELVGSLVSGLYSRPDKLDHAQTVQYEIDLLRFAKDRLSSPQSSRSEADEWMYLEAFLLHYRNLIEFSRGKPSCTDDLSITRSAESVFNGQAEQMSVSAQREPSADLGSLGLRLFGGIVPGRTGAHAVGTALLLATQPEAG